MKYELSEAGINSLLEKYKGTDGYDDMFELAQQFRNDIIAQAEDAYELEYESGMVDDGYYDLCEPLEEEMTFDVAISRLESPGWGFTTDARQSIEEFDSNMLSILKDIPDFKPDANNQVFNW